MALPGFDGDASPPEAHTNQAINVKSERLRSHRAVEDVHVTGLRAGNLNQLLQVSMYYHWHIPPQPASLTPVFRNLVFEDLHAISSGQMSWLGLPESPIRNMRFTDVVIDAYDAHETNCTHVSNLTVSNFTANGANADAVTMSTCAGYPPP